MRARAGLESAAVAWPVWYEALCARQGAAGHAFFAGLLPGHTHMHVLQPGTLAQVGRIRWDTAVVAFNQDTKAALHVQGCAPRISCLGIVGKNTS